MRDPCYQVGGKNKNNSYFSWRWDWKKTGTMLTFFLSHNSVAFKFRRHLTCYLKRYDRHALIETKQSVSCCYMNYGIKWMELLVYVLTHWQSERCTLGHSKTQQLTGSASAVTSGGLPRGFQRPPEGKAGPAFLAAAPEAVPFPTSSLRPWVRGEQGTLPSVSWGLRGQEPFPPLPS